MKMGEKIPGFG